MLALKAFGTPLSQVNQNDFETHDIVFQIGVSPRRIDILTSIEGVEFGSAWAHRLEVELERVVVPVFSREHFIQNKKALGRTQDLADVERLSSGNSEQHR